MNKIKLGIVVLLILFFGTLIFSSGKKSVLKTVPLNEKTEKNKQNVDADAVTATTEKKDFDSNFSYELLNAYLYEDCSVWQDVVISDSNDIESFKLLAKELYKNTINTNYRIYKSRNDLLMKQFGDWDVRDNSDECLLNNNCGSPLSEEVQDWHDKNLVGWVLWIYDDFEESDIKDYSGRWKLITYKDGQHVETINLEDTVSANVLNFKEVGVHENSGKNWHDILICEGFYKGQELVSLAKRLHEKYPDSYFKLYDDDEMLKDYIKFDENYPNNELSPALEEWANLYHIALINKMPLKGGDTPRWALYPFMAIEGIPIEGIYLD